MPGRLRWGLLEGVAVSHAPDSVAGRLWDTGEGWPAARFSRPLGVSALESVDPVDPAGTIPGWVVAVRAADLAGLLPVLDEVETGFRRVRVRTLGGAEAWGYEALVREAWWQAIERWDAAEER